ncbi:MAG: aldo/keto reductase [Thermoanaerobaculales bacterium]|jgi:voltage-dependent potassium channel beta subunit|nr:aldo/keto reductase [Thermoanaerobaculales bacterium]
MEYRNLGRSGLKISALSYGAWVTFGPQMNEEIAAECMHRAWDAGVNFFDNAEAYAAGVAEEIMGAVLAKSGWDRSSYVVSTKIFWGGDGPNQRGLSRKHIVEGTDAALRRFGLDYVDLIFCHRPDLHTPVEETVRAMNHVIDQGKALYWGTSEWPAELILEADRIARREHLIPPVMEQPQYHMFHRERFEREYAPLYERLGLGTTIWSPLAGGLLTGKYNDGIPADSRGNLEGYEWLRERFESDQARRQIAQVRELASVADELRCSMAQLALAWCLTNPHVSTVITGSSRPEQITENMKAMEVVEKLTPEVLERIEEILDNRPKPETDWRTL